MTRFSRKTMNTFLNNCTLKKNKYPIIFISWLEYDLYVQVCLDPKWIILIKIVSTRIYLVEDCHCLDAYRPHLVRLDWLISMHRDSLLLELYRYFSYIEYVYYQTNYWPKRRIVELKISPSSYLWYTNTAFSGKFFFRFFTWIWIW